MKCCLLIIRARGERHVLKYGATSAALLALTHSRFGWHYERFNVGTILHSHNLEPFPRRSKQREEKFTSTETPISTESLSLGLTAGLRVLIWPEFVRLCLSALWHFPICEKPQCHYWLFRLGDNGTMSEESICLSTRWLSLNDHMLKRRLVFRTFQTSMVNDYLIW